MIEASILSAAVKAVGAAITIYSASKKLVAAESWGKDQVAAVRELLNASMELAQMGKGKAQASGELAEYCLLVSAAFGDAFREYWADSDLVARAHRPRMHGVLLLTGDSGAKHREELELRLRIALARWGKACEKGSFETSGMLQGSPIRSLPFQSLWDAFSEGRPELDGTTVDPIVLNNGADVRDFERLFLKAWWKHLGSPVGRGVRSLIDSAADSRRIGMRDLIVSDLATWGRRHVFGNRQPSSPPRLSEEPFLALDAMYVEPLATTMIRDKATGEPAPVQTVLCNLLASRDTRVVVVIAHFGHGKSLSARRLVRDYAVQFLEASTPATERLPVFVHCQSDLVRDELTLPLAVRRAWHRQARELGIDDVALDDSAFGLPGENGNLGAEPMLYVLDGLDEVLLGEREAGLLIRGLLDKTHAGSKAVVFSRPDALPKDVLSRPPAGVAVVEVQPFEDPQISDWLVRWNREANLAITMDMITDKGLADIAKTPILLFMIGSTWRDVSRGSDSLNKSQLYEQFFRDISGTKHKLEPELHPVVVKACSTLGERLAHFPGGCGPEDALLWVLARIAWEERCIEWARELPWAEGIAKTRQLRLRDVEHILEHELQFQSTEGELREVLTGVLLALQSDLERGDGRILFGHKSFREFLVARYWADCLRQIVAADEARRDSELGALEQSLSQARLLDREDGSFVFLRELLFADGRWPLGWSPDERKGLRRWAARCVDDEGLVAGTLRAQKRWMLRESALALGCSFDENGELLTRNEVINDTGRGIRVKAESLRSLVGASWYAGDMSPLSFAEGLSSPGARLSHMSLCGAQLSGADLTRAKLVGADLSYAELTGACMFEADLSGATLARTLLVDVNGAGANFSGANLRDAQLAMANLHGAIFAGADLSSAFAKGANLEDAWLANAVLVEVNLDGAKLENARLPSANLVRASLKDACLDGADLRGADLTGTQLHGATMIGAKYSSRTIPPHPNFSFDAHGMLPCDDDLDVLE